SVLDWSQRRSHPQALYHLLQVRRRALGTAAAQTFADSDRAAHTHPGPCARDRSAGESVDRQWLGITARAPWAASAGQRGTRAPLLPMLRNLSAAGAAGESILRMVLEPVAHHSPRGRADHRALRALL